MNFLVDNNVHVDITRYKEEDIWWWKRCFYYGRFVLFLSFDFHDKRKTYYQELRLYLYAKQSIVDLAWNNWNNSLYIYLLVLYYLVLNGYLYLGRAHYIDTHYLH